MPDHRRSIEGIVRRTVADHRAPDQGKSSCAILEPALIAALTSGGYRCVGQDRADPTRRAAYPAGVPTWRDAYGLQDAGRRRKIDVVVYDEVGGLAALIESENDVSDLPSRSWRCAGYAVESVARNADGTYFSSSNSIERMAIAALSAAFPDDSARQLQERLAALTSDERSAHNPMAIPMFVTLATPLDARNQILKLRHVERRCRSLDCSIVARRTQAATEASIFPAT